MYAWEPPFIRKLEDIRRQELKYVKRVALLECAAKSVWLSSPFLVSINCLYCSTKYNLKEKELSCTFGISYTVDFGEV